MTALVGPIASVRFRDGTVVPYEVPTSTIDPRWKACTEHRVACDCREAEMAEQVAELRAELEGIRKAARDVLAGHPIHAWEEAPDGTECEVGCMCTGCQIVRRAWVLPSYEGGPSARDEVYGLSQMQDECGYRWKVCHDGVRRDHPDVCQWAVTRKRDRFHEHLTDWDGNPVKEDSDSDEVPF